MVKSTVIVGGARTPMGKVLGALSSLSAVQLGGAAIAGALQRSGIDPGSVDQVVFGQVLQAGCGQNPARSAAIAGGIPLDVPAITVNKVCLSGLEAVILADQMIRAGDATVVVAGGMESMSNAPHLLPGSRRGFRYGDVTLVDAMAHDGLFDVYTEQDMGSLTDRVDQRAPIDRVDQEAFALSSHRRADAAVRSGVMAQEIVPVQVPGRRETVTVEFDEGIRADSDAASLAKLRPAFGSTITAATSSPTNDGAAALVVMDKEAAIARGLTWIAEIGPSGQVAGPDTSLQLQPAHAIEVACKKAGLLPTELDLVEINEAFAVVGLASSRALGLDPERVNVDGGAIAIGHPLGMSGARLALHLALALQRRGGGTGVAALCGGGGQGVALLLTAPTA